MTIVETEGKPFIFGEDAIVTIGGVQLNCISNKITLKPDVATVTSTTLCGAVDYPGAEKWTFGGTLYQSFEDNGAYDVLSLARLNAPTPVPYTVQFHSGAKGPNNPEFAGEAVPRAFTIVDSEAGALVEIEFEWGCTGPPTEDFGSGPNPIGTAAAAKVSGALAAAKAPASSSPAA